MAGDTTSQNDPVYTEALTSTIGRPPRKIYFGIQVFVLAATVFVCWVTRGFQQRFEQANLKDLTALTEIVFALGKVLMTPVGLACAIFVVLGLGLLAIKGAIDGFLKFLIWLNVLWLIVFLVMSTAGIWLPILKARQAV